MVKCKCGICGNETKNKWSKYASDYPNNPLNQLKEKCKNEHDGPWMKREEFPNFCPGCGVKFKDDNKDDKSNLGIGQYCNSEIANNIDGIVKCPQCSMKVGNPNFNIVHNSQFLSETDNVLEAEKYTPEYDDEDPKNKQKTSSMSKTSKILLGLAGTGLLAGVIAAGVHYSNRDLNRKRSKTKKKTIKNRRSKRKN